MSGHEISILATAISFFYVLGFVSAIHAVMYARTSQGAIAWALSLAMLPVVSVPIYWVFGRRKFEGYVMARRATPDVESLIPEKLRERIAPHISQYGKYHPEIHAAEMLARIRMLDGNACELLIDGEETFASIFKGIEEAEDYIMIQFYIVHDDELGNMVKERLIARAGQGIRVYFLYDELGSLGLPTAYIDELKRAGINIYPFNTSKGRGNRFQVNFRNHRKVVVIDGKTTWIGGHNIGDEYLGKDPRIGHWRDTHVRIEGPAAIVAQLSFIEDYFWAADEIPDKINWVPTPCRGGEMPVLIMPTGPADEFDTALLMFMHMINSAKRRVWISSPYFIPDESIIAALTLARLRGVDIRILIPEKPDNKLMYYAAYDYFDELSASGIRFYRYQDGFIHEKAVLVDDSLSAIGTANFDNRSFRLNFEITALIVDQDFAVRTEKMFIDDFARSMRMQASDYDDKSFLFKSVVRFCRLLSPVL